MELDDKVVVVTGAANGIGRALARRFHADGARAVVVADLDGAGAAAVAAELDAARPGSALGVACDVGVDAETTALITRAEDGLRRDRPVLRQRRRRGRAPTSRHRTTCGRPRGPSTGRPTSSRRAACCPGWLARGEGYFCSTASAAGLLAQIGSAPYSVTKHAAVAFAEWLSITYGDRGIRVSCLCPMGVNTNMLAGGDQIGGSTAGDVVRATSEVLEPEEVAEVVVEGIRAETFLLLPHPDVLVHLQRKAADVDRWLGGMRRLQARIGRRWLTPRRWSRSACGWATGSASGEPTAPAGRRRW